MIEWDRKLSIAKAERSKIGRNSSACWRELTCLTTHYFTQPIPNPMSKFMHHLPLEFHKVEVALTFFEQLALPMLMLVPVRFVRVARLRFMP